LLGLSARLWQKRRNIRCLTNATVATPVHICGANVVMTPLSKRIEGFAVAIIFATSIGLAIVSPIITLKLPSTSSKEVDAGPLAPEAVSQATQPSTERQQTSVVAQPPEALRSNPTNNMPARIGNAPPGFRDLVWGSVPTKAMIKSGGPYGPQKLSIWRNPSNALQSAFGALVAEEGYLFRDGKLYGGEMAFDGQNNFRKVKEGITKLFGPPDFASEAAQLFKWNWQNPDIELQISYQRSSQRGGMRLRQK
jgi:hypothetical protein